MSWAEEHRMRALESKVRHLEDAVAALELRLEPGMMRYECDPHGQARGVSDPAPEPTPERVRKRRELSDEQRAALAARLAAGRAKAAAARELGEQVLTDERMTTLREVVGRDIAVSYEEDVGELPPGATA